MDDCVLPPIAQIPRKASLIHVPADLDETVREMLYGTSLKISKPRVPFSFRRCIASWLIFHNLRYSFGLSTIFFMYFDRCSTKKIRGRGPAGTSSVFGFFFFFGVRFFVFGR
jgi:hypothetical protein